VASQKDLEFESGYVKMAYKRLEEIKQQIKSSMNQVLEVERGGTHQAKVERDVVVRSSLARLENLEIGDQALIFGRIDFQPPAELSEGESYHIGRVSVNSETMEPLVVDWRAPIAEAFYRATGKDTMGVKLRRHIFCNRDVVVNIEDEWLSSLEEDSLEGYLEPPSPSALFSAISKPRTSYMSDIVSTIQAEQDEIVRHPLSGILVVQGAPGTGKTAVALHRAAYLMYTHRWRFERQPLLVIGPSSEFVKYISRVLPSLGESGVELHTIAGLCGFAEAAFEPEIQRRRLKGDLRMEKLLRKAVRDRERPLRKDLRLAFGRKYLTVTTEMSQELVRSMKRRPGPHNPKRKVIELRLSQLLAEQYLEGGDLTTEVRAVTNVISIHAGLEDQVAQHLPGEDGVEVAREVAAALRKSVEFQLVVERIWPRLSAEETLYDLFSHRALLKLAAKDILSEEEVDVLTIDQGVDVKRHRWSIEDVVLLDELQTFLDEQSDDDVTFGHVIVDEAQDISPMTARLLKRKCPSGSMTILGDLAQSFGPWPNRRWDDILEPLSSKDHHMLELSVNYRTSQEISELADLIKSRYLAGSRRTKSIRSFPGGVQFIEAKDLIQRAVADAKDLFERKEQGRFAMIVPNKDSEALRREIDKEGLSEWESISVIGVEQVRGLEFDEVFILEPLSLVDDAERSLPALYVAVTRATNRIKIYSSQPFPNWLLVK